MAFQPGSSRIRALIITVTGGVGPTGPTGPTGNTGNYATGPVGFPGTGIAGFTYDSGSDGLTFYIQGSTAVYLTGFRGNTGDSATLSPPLISSIGQGISFLGSSGYTLFFRSVTFSSGISASISRQSIIIQDNIGNSGSFDSDRLMFVDFASGTYFLDSSDFVFYKETAYSGNTYGNFRVTQKVGRDLFGVNNFNYSTGSSQNSDHYGLTMTIDSSFYGVTGTENNLKIGAWNPYLRYRANYYDLNGVSGPTYGAISFSPLGPYTKQIKFDVQIGSCCYCDDCQSNDITGRMCEDYVLKEYCDAIEGRWNVLNCYQRENGFDCYRRRACCVNGTCINTSEQKCTQMGGTFCAQRECHPNYDCSSPCISQASGVETGKDSTCCCCKDGIGINTWTTSGVLCTADLSEVANCNATGGTVIVNQCCESSPCIGDNNNCCPTIVGACCFGDSCTPTTPLSPMTPQRCMELNGIFAGPNSTCDDCPT